MGSRVIGRPPTWLYVDSAFDIFRPDCRSSKLTPTSIYVFHPHHDDGIPARRAFEIDGRSMCMLLSRSSNNFPIRLHHKAGKRPLTRYDCGLALNVPVSRNVEYNMLMTKWIRPTWIIWTRILRRRQLGDHERPRGEEWVGNFMVWSSVSGTRSR